MLQKQYHFSCGCAACDPPFESIDIGYITSGKNLTASIPEGIIPEINSPKQVYSKSTSDEEDFQFTTEIHESFTGGSAADERVSSTTAECIVQSEHKLLTKDEQLLPVLERPPAQDLEIARGVIFFLFSTLRT
jgi:hypothetical protein